MNRKGYFNFTLSGYFMMVLPLTLGVSLVSQDAPALQWAFRPCVNGCTCNNTTVTCTDLRLTKIPDRLPPDTTVLDLSSNRINRIHVERLSYMPKLRKLYLRENRITFIPDNMRRVLPQLKILDLSSNLIACRCSLIWLQRQLDIIHWDLQLVNQNTTSCRKYPSRTLGENYIPPNVETCMLQSRQRRYPSCDNLRCQHGECVVDPNPRCVCKDRYSGIYCEIDRTMLADSGSVTITIETTSSNSILISWSVQAGDQYNFLIDVTMVSPTGRGVVFRPIQTNEQRYLLENLQPGATYQVCVTAQGPAHSYMGCINKTTSSLDPTLGPAGGSNVTNLAEVDPQGGDYGKGDGNIFNTKNGKNGDKNDSEGGELEYAFISLAALFGICLLLTILVGFVYYKRIHGMVTEDSETEDPEASRPNQHGIVVVSTGNEMVYNRGSMNPAYDPDDRESGALSRRRPGARSVRFNLTHQPGYSQRGAAAGGTSAPENIPFTVTGSTVMPPYIVHNKQAVDVSTYNKEHIPVSESGL